MYKDYKSIKRKISIKHKSINKKRRSQNFDKHI